MKIKHNESGKVIEVMDGTKYPKSAYTVVDGVADKKAADAKTATITKPAAATKTTATTATKATVADKKAADAKTDK